MTDNSNIQPGVPLPSGPPANFWKSWIWGIIVTITLSFLKNKWGPLLALKKKVDEGLETAENVTEIVEKVAEELEKVADDVAEKLTEGGKLRDAICLVENIAKETAKDAHIAEDIIEKVEEVEKEVESLIKPAKNPEKMVAEEKENKIK